MKGFFRALFLLLIAGTFTVQMAKAQKGLKLGIVALPMSTWMLNNDDLTVPEDIFKYQTTFGMSGGPLVGYNFNDNMGLRLNFLYSSQGQKHSYANAADPDGIVNETRRISYLKLPIMFSYNTPTEINKMMFTAALGIQTSLLVKAKKFDDDESYTPDEILWYGITDYPTTYRQYKWIDFGPVAQVGMDLKLTYNVMANFRIRADYGLIDAENKNASYYFWDKGVATQQLLWDQNRAKTHNLTAGIVFGLTYTFLEY